MGSGVLRHMLTCLSGQPRGFANRGQAERQRFPPISFSLVMASDGTRPAVPSTSGTSPSLTDLSLCRSCYVMNRLFLPARRGAGPRGAQEETRQEVSITIAPWGMSWRPWMATWPGCGCVDRLSWSTCGEPSTLAAVDGHVAGVAVMLTGCLGRLVPPWRPWTATWLGCGRH